MKALRANDAKTLQWHSHPARKLLEQDVANEFHLHMKPKELWGSRKEYMEFSLDVFRNHKDQEIIRIDKLASKQRVKKKKTRYYPYSSTST